MKITSIKTNDALKQEITQMINDAEDKNAAVFDAIDRVVEAQLGPIVNQVVAEAEQAAHDADYRKALNLPVLSKEEKAMVQLFRSSNPKQAVSVDKQETIFPETTINRVFEALHADSDVLSLVNFAPAGVSKWVTGSVTGAAVWGEITAEITAELTASLASINLDTNLLSAYIACPKPIRELSDDALVYRFIILALTQAVRDGLEAGYINGDGKNAPIGLTKQIESVEQDGTHTAKTVVTTVTGFSPKSIANVRKTLTNNGKRKVSEIALICNPLDEAEYVDPALFGEKPEGGYKDVSFLPLKKYVSVNCPQGTAIFTLPGVYTMGLRNVQVVEYRETQALKNLDTYIATAYGNGRADDDNCAVVIDVTKLEEYIPAFRQVTSA